MDFLTFMEAKILVYKIDNYRDYAMVLVMLYGGLRVSEVCGLDRENIDFEEFTIAVRNTKNRIDRTVIVTEKCINAIEWYLETRDDIEKPLFLSQKKRRTSRNRVNRLVKKYAIMAALCRVVSLIDRISSVGIYTSDKYPVLIRSANVLAHTLSISFAHEALETGRV